MYFIIIHLYHIINILYVICQVKVIKCILSLKYALYEGSIHAPKD